MSWFSDLFKRKKLMKIIPDGESLNFNENFIFALNYTLKNEGGLSNDKFDHGGITKFGIILDDLRQMGHPDAVAKNIEDLTVDEAKYIYKKLYWDKLNLDLIKSKEIACAMFDIGVVRGIGIPPKYCKQIYGSSEPEIINTKDPKVFILKFSDLCKLGFQQIVEKNPTQKRFLNGWLNRAERLKSLI